MIRAAACFALTAFLALGPPSGRAAAAEVPEAVLVLEAAVALPGRVPGAAPPRFVLLRDGRVFVGGSDSVYAGRLDGDSEDAIEDRVKELRKAGLLVPAVAFGDDLSKRYRLRVLEDGPVDVVVTGDPSDAAPAQQPLAAFLGDLLRFHHPSLQPFAPDAYALSAREGLLVGGCRTWTFSVPVEEALSSPRRVPAAETERWPTGADPASVCADGRRLVVTLRPLLPGETP